MALYTAEDFKYAEVKGKIIITGFSESGLKKLETNKAIDFPAYTPDGKEIKEIGSEAFKALDIMKITDWGNIEVIYESAFKGNQIEELPTNWNKVIAIGDGAFADNQIKRLPDFGGVRVVAESSFSNNQIAKIAGWGAIEWITDWAFMNNQIEELPANWGKVEAIGWGAFLSNQIKEIPSFSNSNIESIEIDSFAGNPVSDFNIKPKRFWLGLSRIPIGVLAIRLFRRK